MLPQVHNNNSGAKADTNVALAALIVAAIFSAALCPLMVSSGI